MSTAFSGGTLFSQSPQRMPMNSDDSHKAIGQCFSIELLNLALFHGAFQVAHIAIGEMLVMPAEDLVIHKLSLADDTVKVGPLEHEFEESLETYLLGLHAIVNTLR